MSLLCISSSDTNYLLTIFLYKGNYLYPVQVLQFEDLDERIEEKLINNPAYFSEKVLGVKLHWYQKQVINDPYPDKAMCWSRQIGKSTMVAIYVVWYIFTHADKNILILSQDRDASRRFYNLVISYIIGSPLLANSIDGDTLQSYTKFTNGTTMINKAPGREGKSSRGDVVDLLIVDEADFIAEEVFVAAEQTTASTDGAIILISTPNKKGSTFYQYFTDGLDAWKKAQGEMPLEEDDDPEYFVGHPAGSEFEFKSYHFDYNVGLNVDKILPNGRKQPQLALKKVNRMRKKRAYWKFQQEYEAVWAEDVASYFSTKQIKDAIDETYEMQDFGQPGRIYYMGVDFAKHTDRTVALVGEIMDDGRCRIVHIYAVHGRDWVLQTKDIKDIAERFPIKRAFLDGTGVGDAMYDTLNGVESPLFNRCERIVFTMPTKNNVYQNLSNLFHAGRLIIPHHKQLVDELMFVQYEKMEGSNYVRIHEPKGMKDIGDDYPDASALLGMGMSKNLLIGAFQGYLVRKNISPYPNFWNESQGLPAGSAIENPMWDVKGAIITRTKPKGHNFGNYGKRARKSRYSHRWN